MKNTDSFLFLGHPSVSTAKLLTELEGSCHIRVPTIKSPATSDESWKGRAVMRKHHVYADEFSLNEAQCRYDARQIAA